MEPYGVALTPDSGHVYVTSRDNSRVSAIETRTDRVAGTIPRISVTNECIANARDIAIKSAWAGGAGPVQVNAAPVPAAPEEG